MRHRPRADVVPRTRRARSGRTPARAQRSRCRSVGPNADCSRIVVAGHSQAGMITPWAANWAGGVRAGWALGVFDSMWSTAFTSREHSGTRALPDHAVRVVTGRTDMDVVVADTWGSVNRCRPRHRRTGWQAQQRLGGEEARSLGRAAGSVRVDPRGEGQVATELWRLADRAGEGADRVPIV